MIELMIVVALVAALLTIGMPGIGEMVQNNRRASATNYIIGALQQARSEAVKRNASVTVCPSTSGTACTGSTTWDNGWIMFIDSLSSGTVGTVDSGEELFQVNKEGVTPMTARTSFSYLTFKSNGRLFTSATGDPSKDEEAEFILCDTRGTSEGRAVLIFRSGRPEVSTTDLNNAALGTCTP